jgi:hypothetical protein
MASIAGIVADLDAASQDFAVEALASVIKPRWIEEALHSTGRQSRRNRVLPAPLVVWTVILLGMFRRHSYVTLLGLLANSLWLRTRWSRPPSSSALSQARRRLGFEPIRALFEKSAASIVEEIPGQRVAGLRLMSIDGSTIRVPDSHENRAHFGTQHCGRGRAAYPLMRIATLVDTGSHATVAARQAPYCVGEMTLARQLVAALPKDSLLCLDRNFGSYELLWDIARQGGHFVVRRKRHMKGETVHRFSRNDRLVRIRLLSSLRKKRPDLPITLIVREVTYRPSRRGETIRVFTSVTDPAVLSAEQVAEAYGMRWVHETTLDESKTHLLDHASVNRPALLRSMTPGMIQQELYGALIAHNATRVLLHRAASRAGTSGHRLSFVAGLERVREAVRDMMQLPTQRLPERYDRLLESLTWVQVPPRPGRSFPRVIKVKMSHYNLKRTRGRAA